MRQICNAWGSNLSKLYLADNALEALQFIHLVSNLQRGQITTLHFQGNELWDPPQAPGMEALFTELGCCTHLTELYLGNTALHDRGILMLHDHLSHVPLQSLDLGGNAISQEGFEVLARVVSHHSSLTSLDLSDNWMGDEGLAHWLPETVNTTLHSLILDSISIRLQGVTVEVFARFRGLTHLYMVDNELTPATALALTDALRPCGLTDIDLSDNHMGQRVAGRLLRIFSGLMCLRLFACELNNIGMTNIGRSLRQHCNLTALHLDYNDALVGSISGLLQ